MSSTEHTCGYPAAVEWTATEIRRRRLARGLTQDELAHHLGVSRSIITKWETGAREPYGSSIRKLQRVLGDPDTGRRDVTLAEATDIDLITELLNRLARTHPPTSEEPARPLTETPLRWDETDRPAARRKHPNRGEDNRRRETAPTTGL